MIDGKVLKQEIEKIIKPMWHIGVSIHNPNVGNLLNIEDVKLNKKQLMNLIDKLDKLDKPEQTDINMSLSTPVIPQVVYNWIKESKSEGKGLAFALSYLITYGWDDDTHSDFMVYKYLQSNEEDFIRAWLTYPNINVEQEKLYRVKLPDGGNKPDEFFALVKRNNCITI